MKHASKASDVVMAAGGIVIRESAIPLVGVVRLRKDKSWVLPKGKLKRGETPIAAAEREVEEETGHGVTVMDYLGALSHASEDRHKIVQFWHMRASPAPVRPLMKDIREVKWLPLRLAIETLSRDEERVFLSHVGPIALKAAEQAHLAEASAAVVEATANDEPQSKTFLDMIRAWLGRGSRSHSINHAARS